jgi:glutathione-regulated potassium-efflux system ancillary protein KefG
VLILYAHPHAETSRANRALREAVEGRPGVTLHDLYEHYPDFFIDVAHEQALLRGHDAIVFQHPFYWYSCPPLLKEWMDRVLEHGFAYGEGGTALRGKHFLQVVTTAGSDARYRHGGLNHFTMRELLRPFEQSAHLCGLVTHAPLVMHSVRTLDDAQLAACAQRYRSVLDELAAGRPPPEEHTYEDS